MSLIIIFSILVIHWVADFIFQTNAQAKGKSTDMGCLLSHTSVYSSVWLVASVVYSLCFGFGMLSPILFTGITFLLHTITDYFTSRLNSYLWKKGDVHNFFVSVGFDQVLHYVQLFLTFSLLFL